MIQKQVTMDDIYGLASHHVAIAQQWRKSLDKTHKPLLRRIIVSNIQFHRTKAREFWSLAYQVKRFGS